MSDGIVVLDINDPNFPVIGSYNDSGQAYGIFTSDNYVYVTDLVYGLKILEITVEAPPSRNFSGFLSLESGILFGMIPLSLLIISIRRRKHRSM